MNFFLLLFFNLFYFFAVKPQWNFVDPSSVLRLNGDAAKLSLTSGITNFNGTVDLINKTSFNFLETPSNNSFNLSKGVVKNDSGTLILSANLKLNSSVPAIFLEGNASLDLNEKVLFPIFVSGLNNKIIGLPDFSTEITLIDANSELILGIATKFNTNIFLNSGKIKLSKDLIFKENCSFEGSGIIDLNGYGLFFSNNQNVINNHLTFLNCADLNLKYKTSISGSWTFSGINQQSNLIGYGTILNMENAGIIKVNQNHQLIISSLHIKGLGDNEGSKLDVHETSTVIFNFTTLELSSDLTFTNGTLLFNSDNCNLVTKQNNKLNLISSKSNLIIDGVLLRCDSLNNPGNIPITQTNVNLKQINGGAITPGLQTITNQNLEFVSSSSDSTNELNINLDLSSQKTVLFKNENQSQRKNMIFDGNQNKISFVFGDKKLLTLEPNIDLVIKNTTFYGFDPSKIDLQGDGDTKSKLIFDENVILQTKQEVTFDNFNYIFNKNCYLDCGNNSLLLRTPLLIAPHVSLTINLANLLIHNESALELENDASTLIIKKSNIVLNTSNLVFNKGNLHFLGVNKLSGITTSPASEFNFTSLGVVKICTSSSLQISNSIKFICDPNVSLDSNNAAKKRHFVFENESSRLILVATVFNIGQHGLAFDIGNIDIIGSSTFEISQNQDAELELSENVNLNIGDEIIFTGPVRYC